MVSTVLVTCVVAASALTGTYMLTRERIIEQERAAERQALQTVLPGASEFAQAEELLDDAIEAAGDVTVVTVYRADDASGEATGWGVRVAPRGYAGPIQMIVGLDRDGLVTGVSIITMAETPGLGTKIVTEPGWMDQFTGWDGSDIEAAADDFDNIAGATRSAVAIRNGVTAAGLVYSEVLSQESGEGESQ
jgi:Na+-translocating ferredoxin:NAD+ oxidoreductase subunit G